VSILAHPAAVVEGGQAADLQSVLSSSFSKQALLPTSIISDDASSCTVSSSLMPGHSADCTDLGEY